MEGIGRSARIFGNKGPASGQRSRVRLSRPDVLSAVSALKEARFGAMPSHLGQEGDKPKLRER
jgi:hypothetical protein